MDGGDGAICQHAGGRPRRRRWAWRRAGVRGEPRLLPQGWTHHGAGPVSAPRLTRGRGADPHRLPCHPQAAGAHGSPLRRPPPAADVGDARVGRISSSSWPRPSTETYSRSRCSTARAKLPTFASSTLTLCPSPPRSASPRPVSSSSRRRAATSAPAPAAVPPPLPDLRLTVLSTPSLRAMRTACCTSSRALATMTT